jgi:hypothetical protein
MLYRLLLFITLFFSAEGFAQKSYEFDYVMQYQCIPRAPGAAYTEYRFLNSKDNSIILMVREDKGDVLMKMIVDKTAYYGKTPREDFFVEAISLKCPYSNTITSDKKKKDYTVIRQPDTIINTESFRHYILQPLNDKKIEKEKLLPEHYIIGQFPGFDVPFMGAYDWAAKIWESVMPLPNGILNEFYESDSSGIVQSSVKLVEVVKLKKIIYIDKNCR